MLSPVPRQETTREIIGQLCDRYGRTPRELFEQLGQRYQQAIQNNNNEDALLYAHEQYRLVLAGNVPHVPTAIGATYRYAERLGDFDRYEEAVPLLETVLRRL